MRLKFALRTLLLSAAWLILQNFNLHPTCAEGSGRCEHAPAGKSRESCYTDNNKSPDISQPPGSAYLIKKIVLDAGHGGKDPGCIGASSREKDNALAIVLKLGDLIKNAYPDVQVIYTRDSDVFIELNERAAIANRNNADLFISVHCNSISVSSVKGAETYVMGLHTASHNLEVAKRENASIYLEENYEKNYEGYDPNSPEAHILGSVWQSAYLEQSILFASLVQQQAKTTAFRNDRGVKQAGFLVLRETAMPAVLIETGYLTNRTEEDFIASETGREQMATAIFEAFEAYKIKMEGGATASKTRSDDKKTANSPSMVAKGGSTGTSVNSRPATVQAPVKVEKQANKVADTAKKQSVPVSNTTTGKNNTRKETYRIFLLSWPIRMDRNAGQLGLIGDIKEEKIEDQYHYFTGNYDSRAEAEKMLPEIKNLGFKTAAIVATSGK